jgi:hypothetical protein
MESASCALSTEGSPKVTYYRGASTFTAGPSDTLPYIGTAKGGRPSQHQYKQHLLCSFCERRFNEGGEKYVLEIMNRRNQQFPLLAILQGASVTLDGGYWLQYSVQDTPTVDRAKLAYFGISVFWRASIVAWQDAFGGSEVRINLGDKYNEEVRRYLLGEASMPTYAFLTVYVCSDADSATTSFAPGNNEKTKAGKITGFLVRGLEFHFGI